jgi:Protein of unknown function (DUF3085)
MSLTFSNEGLKLLLNSAKVRWPLGLRDCYADDVPGKPEEGFWIVGDEGVYVMHNGTLPDGDVLPFVVYANECNPKTMEFEHWWEVKNRTFGADDGVEFIPRATMEGVIASGNDLGIYFAPDMMSVAEVITDKADPMHPDNRGFDGPTGAE